MHLQLEFNFPQAAISSISTGPVATRSTGRHLRMRASKSTMNALSSSPWPTEARTPTGHSSLSLPPQRLTSTRCMSFLDRSVSFTLKTGRPNWQAYRNFCVSLYRCSSEIKAQGELRALDGCRFSSKSPLRVRDGDERVSGRNGSEKFFPDEGSLIYPPGKSMIFFTFPTI